MIFGDFAPNQLCLTYPKKGLLTSQRLVSGKACFGKFCDHEKSWKNHKENHKKSCFGFYQSSTGFLIKLIFSCNNQFWQYHSVSLGFESPDLEWKLFLVIFK